MLCSLSIDFQAHFAGIGSGSKGISLLLRIRSTLSAKLYSSCNSTPNPLTSMHAANKLESAVSLYDLSYCYLAT